RIEEILHRKIRAPRANPLPQAQSPAAQRRRQDRACHAGATGAGQQGRGLTAAAMLQIPDWMDFLADIRPADMALVTPRIAVTHAQMRQRSWAAAHELEARGV